MITRLVIAVLCLPILLSAADFNVTSPGSYYAINGINAQNPTLTLTRGQTYTFAINTDPLHPFQISEDDATGEPYFDGVNNNNISQGTITFTVPLTAPSTLYYMCSLHFFSGTINIVGSAGPPADFNVSTPGGNFAYTINSFPGDNPTLTLTRGITYTFDIDASPDHPFAIVSSMETGEPYNDGVENNNISQGRITFTVPANAPSTLYYICSLHFFGGTLNIVDPAPIPEPMVKVISISVGSDVVTLRSLGTNGWSAVPEFSSNLMTGSWDVVPNFTNVFSNGTNTTTFNRLDPICGPNVFLRVKNTRD